MITERDLAWNKVTERELAREMAEAYARFNSQGEAVEHVKDKYDEADIRMLWVMWHAIDEYADIRTRGQ